MNVKFVASFAEIEIALVLELYSCYVLLKPASRDTRMNQFKNNFSVTKKTLLDAILKNILVT